MSISTQIRISDHAYCSHTRDLHAYRKQTELMRILVWKRKENIDLRRTLANAKGKLRQKRSQIPRDIDTGYV